MSAKMAGCDRYLFLRLVFKHIFFKFTCTNAKKAVLLQIVLSVDD
jgi:hypothetical protein